MKQDSRFQPHVPIALRLAADRLECLFGVALTVAVFLVGFAATS
jgi:hypothetical protein